MHGRIKIAVAGATLAALTAGGAGVAAASGQAEDAERPDVPITGAALEQASAVALDHLGQGRVTETEVEDEESYYEVEVTLDDGRQVDVQLDRAFAVVGQEADDDSGADRD